MFIKLKCLFVCITQLRNENIIEVAVSNYLHAIVPVTID